MGMTLLERDSFTCLFGGRRGLLDVRASVPPTTALLKAALLGRPALPAGLTLLAGSPGSDKTAVATLLTSQLAIGGTAVSYLDCDRANAEALCYAQLPAQPGARKHTLSSCPEAQTAFSLAESFASSGPSQVVILDSLSTVDPTDDEGVLRSQGVHGNLRLLSNAAQRNGMPALATCSEAMLTALTRAGIGAQLVLHIKAVAFSERACTLELSDDDGQRLRLRLDRNSSLITLT
jgi:hypothetical protein